MSIDFATLRDADPARFGAATRVWERLADEAQDQAVAFRQGVISPVNDGSWRGPAATAGQQAVTKAEARLIATERYLDAAGLLLGDTVSGITIAQNRLKEALGIAASAGVPVSGNGEVSLSGAASAGTWDSPSILAAMRAQNMINQALHMADVLDGAIVPGLDLARRFEDDPDSWVRLAEPDHDRAEKIGEQLSTQLAKIPMDEPVHHDTAPQPYSVDLPGPQDITLFDAFAGAAIPYFEAKGWPHAAGLFAHWLSNSGATATVHPDEIMSAVPTFSKIVEEAVDSGSDKGHFDTGWLNTSTEDAGGSVQSLDWYYALNDFRYRVVGRSSTDPRRNDYTVGILKPYVFGPPRNPIPVPILSKAVPSARIDQKDIEHLHTCGIAQNFIVEGIWHHTQ